MNFFTPIVLRRRKLLGKQKIQYSDMDAPMKDGKINLVEKQQFIEEFRLKQEGDKKKTLILLVVIVAVGILAISLMFLLSPS